MAQFIDRRLNGKHKSAPNRQRFIRRYHEQIKKAVADAITGRGMTDINQGEKISIPARDLSEPNFGFGQGGVRERLLPGNKEFISGDRIPRPPGGGGKGGGGGQASPEGEGVDEFMFELSREEFMQFFFEDLELPDLVRKELSSTEEQKPVRAGFTSSGVPTNLSVIRTMRGATGRRIALGAAHKWRLLEAEQELALEQARTPRDEEAISGLQQEIMHLRGRLKAIPYIDDFDLRFRNRIYLPQPSTQAVMLCLMDVSGSMTQDKKDMAKRFFMLLYLFLIKNYEKIQVVFIRHHTQAQEVNEQEFFHSRETGGTVVSSALAMAHDVITERYPSGKWNIYIAQASDGDNWDDDCPRCVDLLVNHLLPASQYFAYVEIGDHTQIGKLWRDYTATAKSHEHLAVQRIKAPKDIYPVFRNLFQKKKA